MEEERMYMGPPLAPGMVELRTIIPEEVDRYLESIVESGPFNNKAELVRAALAAYTSSVAGPKAQEFDKENIFAPDGQVYQFEYARESALRGLPSIGMSYPKGVMLMSRTASSSVNEWYPKIRKINSELAVSTTGLLADGHVTVRKVRESKAKSIDEFIEETSEWFWENTSQRNRRPLGIYLMAATIMGGEPRLLCFEPSGACLVGRAIAVGRGSQRMQALLGSERAPRNGKEAEEIALRALGKPQKWEHDDVLHLDLP